MAIKFPRVIAHRGASAYAPENTLAAIRTAADMGVTWVELDVKLTKDNIPVIFHDDTLERTTNGHGNIADILYEDLKQLDAGHWFAESFTGETVPTLEEAVDVILEHGLGLNLEIKPCPTREIDTAEAVLDHLSQIWDDNDTLLISSFSSICLEIALDMAPDYHRGVLLDEVDETWPTLFDHIRPSTLNINGNTVTQIQMNDFLEAEVPILAYTINDPLKAKKLHAMGVDGFFSDSPDIILENLPKTH